MKKQHRPTIPLLGEAAMGRIERGVFAALEGEGPQPMPARSSRRWAYGLAMAAALSVALIGLPQWRRSSSPHPHSAHITAGATGFHVAMEGAALDLAPESSVTFGERKNGATLLVLDRGRITCEVEPRSSRAPFVVQAGSTRVVVVGTRFSVERMGDHASVSVERGVVEVTDEGAIQVVHAGERYRPDAKETELMVPAALPSTTSRAAPKPALAEAEPQPAPVVAAAPAKTRAQTHRTIRTPPPSPSTLTQPKAPSPAAAPSVQQRFEAAARLETRDPEGALRLYEDIAAGPTGWAANALFAAGRLEVERGQAARGRRLLESYLTRFPSGLNAEDARTLLSKIR